jgi:hypothetical protein
VADSVAPTPSVDRQHELAVLVLSIFDKEVPAPKTGWPQVQRGRANSPVHRSTTRAGSVLTMRGDRPCSTQLQARKEKAHENT